MLEDDELLLYQFINVLEEVLGILEEHGDSMDVMVK